MSEKFVLETGFTIDWISATFPEHKGFAFVTQMCLDDALTHLDSVPPRGYTHAQENEWGFRWAWNEKRNDMGVHCVMSGACLRKYIAHGFSWHSILDHIKRLGGRTSRVDLALDARNSTIRLVHLAKPNLRRYKGKGRTPRVLPVGTQEDGWTVYVGSRESEKYLRIYDKAKEQKNFIEDYIRIELECKGEIAHAIGWEFPNLSEQACVDMAKTLIRGQADYNLESWDAILASNVVALVLPQGRERDTFGWLINVCAPALAKQMAAKPNDDVLGAFWDSLRERLASLGIETPE